MSQPAQDGVDHTDPEGTALETVFREHYRFVWRYMRHLGLEPNDVEDGVQDVFLVVNRKLGQFEGPDMRAWLAAIARWIARDYYKRSVRRERRNRSPQPKGPQDTQDEWVDRQRAGAFVQRFVETLPPAQRDVFVLMAVEGLDGPAVASSLGCPLNTVYSRLRLARRRFAKEAKKFRESDPSSGPNPTEPKETNRA